jgi:hypothetical protein
LVSSCVFGIWYWVSTIGHYWSSFPSNSPSDWYGRQHEHIIHVCRSIDIGKQEIRQSPRLLLSFQVARTKCRLVPQPLSSCMLVYDVAYALSDI